MNLEAGTSKLNNYLLPTTGGALKWVRQPGMVHDRVFLEAIPISCLSSLWFQWSLSVEGMKERKKKYSERDGIWEKMKERKKKKCSETKREETLRFGTSLKNWKLLLKTCVKIRVMLFKSWKLLFENMYQTPPDFPPL